MSGRAFGPVEGAKLVVASWGCGVQSTTMISMSALGDLEPIDLVIHADAGWEQKQTVELRNWYTKWLTARGHEVVLLPTGDIRREGAEEHTHIPFWTSGGGPLTRQCTREFKIRPIKRFLRQTLGYPPSKPPHPPPGSIEQWIGFSLDEWTRMADSRVQYIVNRWPLIERKMTRNDCKDYLESHGLPVPPKSSCVGCPYRRASEWLDLRRDSPEEWEEAVAFDNANRNADRLGVVKDPSLYVYQKCVPLEEADLEEDAKRERQGKQLPLMICDSGQCFT